MHRKLRTAAVAGVAVALFAAACGSGSGDSSGSASGGSSQAKDITVWLMNGSAPDAVVKSVNAQFNQAHPGTKVNIEIQQWDGIQEKTTTALAGNNPPDVLEIGSTLVSKFADSGGLEDLSGKKADLGGDDWLQGLTDAGTLDGKLYGDPLLRRRPRGALPQGPLRQGRHHHAADRPGRLRRGVRRSCRRKFGIGQAVLRALLPRPVLVRGAAVHLGRGRRGRGPGRRPVEGHAGQPAVAGRAELRSRTSSRSTPRPRSTATRTTTTRPSRSARARPA